MQLSGTTNVCVCFFEHFIYFGYGMFLKCQLTAWTIMQNMLIRNAVVYTRKHPSRMRSTHLEAIPASVQWPPQDAAPGRAGVPDLNKFENVSSDHHQRSLGWGSPGLMCRGIPHLTCSGDTLPCDLSDDAFDVTYPLVNSQTPVKTLTWSVSLFINEWHRFQTHWVSYLIGFVEFVSYLLSLLPD